MLIPLITHPLYSFDFPGKHRFPMEKFSLLATYLREQQLLKPENLFRPGVARREILLQGHCPHYLDRFINNQQSAKEVRRMGLPWSEGLMRRTLISPNGSLLTANLALKYGVACHLAGGTHHAHFDFASGFCILNDLAITAKTLLAQKKVNKVVIFDCDVHQGDGTANILADQPNAYTCSIHCEKNFPARKAISDWDVELSPKMEDEQYLSIVSQTLTQIIHTQQPDFFIYDAGVDIFAQDPLGLLSISTQGIRRRDRLVLDACRDNNIPIMTVIGGGYDDDRLALAMRHAIVVEEAFASFAS